MIKFLLGKVFARIGSKARDHSEENRLYYLGGQHRAESFEHGWRVDRLPVMIHYNNIRAFPEIGNAPYFLFNPGCICYLSRILTPIITFSIVL